MDLLSDLAGVLPAFLLATLLLAMIPGPATALVIKEAVRGDARSAARTVAGTEAGILAWALASALGLAALVAASEVAYNVLRLVGALVLVVLGVQTLWHARRDGEPSGMLKITGFRGGLATNLANPKAAVFAFSFYPQFVPDGAPVFLATVLLALVQVVVDGGWYVVVVFAVTRVRRIFETPRVRRGIERITGAVLVGLGLRLAIEQR